MYTKRFYKLQFEWSWMRNRVGKVRAFPKTRTKRHYETAANMWDWGCLIFVLWWLYSELHGECSATSGCILSLIEQDQMHNLWNYSMLQQWSPKLTKFWSQSNALSLERIFCYICVISKTTIISEILIRIHYMNFGIHDLFNILKLNLAQKLSIWSKASSKYKESLHMKQEFIIIYHTNKLILWQYRNLPCE